MIDLTLRPYFAGPVGFMTVAFMEETFPRSRPLAILKAGTAGTDNYRRLVR